MESPVRIIGAAVVVHLVLMSSSYVKASTIPPSDSKLTTVSIQRTPFVRFNSTAGVRSKITSTEDPVADNGISGQEELERAHEDVKEFVESTKKTRGRVKYTNHRSTTPLPRKRTNIIKSGVAIVTPEPEMKNISQILNSMRNYKNFVSSSTTSPRDKDVIEGSMKSNNGDEDDNFDFDSDFNHENYHNSQHATKNDHIHKELRKSPQDSFSSQTKSSYKDNFNKQTKAPSKYFTSSFNKYLDILTTPKNDFFDKKYSSVAKSITDNVNRHVTQNSKTKANYDQTDGHVPSRSKNFEDYMNNKLPNNSRLYFHQSKSILVSDNEAEGSSLSDTQGTSIYFEKSVLTTESYGNVPNTEEETECDENERKEFIPVSLQQTHVIANSSSTELESSTAKPAVSQTSEVTLTVSTTSYPRRTNTPKRKSYIVNTSALKNNNNLSITTSKTGHTTSNNSTASSNNKRYNSINNDDSNVRITSTSRITTIPLKPVSLHPFTDKDNAKIEKLLHKSDETINSIQKPLRPIQPSLPGETDNFTTVAENKEDLSNDGTLDAVIKSLTKSSTQQNQTSTEMTPTDALALNSDTAVQTETASDVFKAPRRIQYTTPIPKTRYRMSVRRNFTNTVRPSYPTTIYAEHFNIKPKQDERENKTLLTTVSSAIDPVYQPEIGGAKKIVHSHVISDNSIPTLRKRGSTRYGIAQTSVLASSEETLSIPTASSSWGALAGMRNPPSLSSSSANATAVKNPDENELQGVVDTDKQAMAFDPATIIRNNLDVSTIPAASGQWKPLYVSLQRNSSQTPIQSQFSETIDIITARPLDSPPTTQSILTNELTGETKVDTLKSGNSENSSEWIPVNDTDVNKVDKKDKAELSTPQKNKTIGNVSGLPINRGLENNTRIPSKVTTPTVEASSVPETTESPVPTAASVEITRKPSSTRTVPVRTTVRITPVRTTSQTAPVGTATNLSESATSEPLVTMSSESLPKISSKPMAETTFVTTVSHLMSSESLPKTSAKPMSETTFVTTVSHLEPTADTAETTIATTQWHDAVVPNNATFVEYVSTKLDNLPVTTYRPTYSGNTEVSSETETVFTTAEYVTISSMTRGDLATKDSDTFTMTNAISESEQSEIVENSSEPITKASTEYITELNTLQSEVTTTAENEDEIVTTVETEELELKNTTTETILTPNLPKEKSEEISSPDVQNNPKDDYTEEAQLTEVSTSVESQATEVLPVTEDTKSTDQATQGKIEPTTVQEDATTEEVTTPARTESRLEDLTANFAEDLTTHSPNSGHVSEENSSAAGVAIAVSTIGVIALLLLIGLLLVLRRRRLRGRRCGVYAQRCTPVSLDAYSLDSVSVRRKGTRLRASKRSYGNPAYDDEVVISHPMQYAALASFALNSESVAAEFSEIPSGSVRADEVPPGCEDKNRFSNVLPLPETRVPLQRIDGDPTSEYINANYVTGPGNIKNYYIACQAPMANTVNDFWRMVWEQNSRVIVMLTEYMENGAERCHEYLPPSEITDNKRKFGDLQITLKRREQYDKYAVSSLQLKNLTSNTWREVTHLWYLWPAKGVPDDYDSVINFMSEMRSYMKMSQNAKEFDEDDAPIVENGSSGNAAKLSDCSPGSGRGVHVYSPQKAEETMRKGVANGNSGTLGRMKAAAEVEGVRPCVVTCASGAGRTGALLALDLCARALEGSGAVDVPRAVRGLRASRPHAVQNKNQYIFLYKVLSEYGHKLHGGVDSI